MKAETTRSPAELTIDDIDRLMDLSERLTSLKRLTMSDCEDDEFSPIDVFVFLSPISDGFHGLVAELAGRVKETAEGGPS